MSEMGAVTFHEAVAVEYRRAVSQGDVKTGINRQDAFAHAAEALMMRVHCGEIEIPLEDAIHSALLAADTREGAATDGMLSQLVAGEIGLDLWPDPSLERVVVLGRGIRKPWKNVTAEDLAGMYDLRKQNTNAARRAERRFLKDLDAIYTPLVSAGTVGAMVAAARAERMAATA